MHLDKNSDIRITSRLILKHLNDDDEHLPNLSIAEVKYIVKIPLKYSYKKTYMLQKK